MGIDFWSILIIVFVFQGLFVLFSILSSRKRRSKPESPFLVLVILVLFWFLIEFLSVRNTYDVGVNLFYGTRYGAWLVVGPLVYFYFKSITQSKWTFSKIDALHFIPFLVFAFIIPLMFEEVLTYAHIHYGMLSVFFEGNKIATPLQYLYTGLFILQFVHFGIYLLKSLKLVLNYKKALQVEFAQINEKVKWLRIFLLSFLIILIFTSIFLFVLFKTNSYRRYLDHLYVVPIGFLYYVIGYYLMDVHWEKAENKVVKYANSSLNTENLPDYIGKIDGLMKDDKIYLDPDIRLKDLAKKIEISGHHLSQIINQHYGFSYYDFINKHRVENAKKLIQKDPDRLMFDVAFESGFNNKTSFVNSFKKFEKMTPSKYREQQVSS